MGHESYGDICFDLVVKTPRGEIFTCRFIRETEVAADSTEEVTRMDIEQAHTLLGNGNEDAPRKAAKELGWEIV